MNNKELALLGLLAESPKYGYQIEADIETRGMREWTEIGFSSIYYLLNKAEGLGWIKAARQDSDEGPSRKVYTLTGAGLTELRSGIARRLENPDPNSGDIQLALAFLPVLPPEDADGALLQYRQRLEQDLARVQTRLEEQSPLPPHVCALFDYSLHKMQAELAWIKNFLEKRKAKQNDKNGL
jgi:DNA-binding PadR family transcriptional regulator